MYVYGCVFMCLVSVIRRTHVKKVNMKESDCETIKEQDSKETYCFNLFSLYER